MFHGNYGFTFRLESEAYLLEFNNSTFRTFVVQVFRQVACSLRRSACLLKQECIYTRAFESESALAAVDTGHRSLRSFLHTVQPLFNGKTFYPRGTPFKFKPPLFKDLSRRAWQLKWARTPLPGKDGGR